MEADLRIAKYLKWNKLLNTIMLERYWTDSDAFYLQNYPNCLEKKFIS